MSTTFKQSRDESEIEIDESGLLPHEWVKKQRTDSEVKRMRESEDEQDSEILAEYHRQLRLNVPIEKTMFSTDRVVYSEHIKNMFRSWPPGLRIEDIEGSEFDEIVDDCEDCKVFNYGTSAFTTTPLMYILLGDFFDSYSPKTPSLDFKCYALSLIKISQLDLHIEDPDYVMRTNICLWVKHILESNGGFLSGSSGEFISKNEDPKILRRCLILRISAHFKDTQIVEGHMIVLMIQRVGSGPIEVVIVDNVRHRSYTNKVHSLIHTSVKNEIDNFKQKDGQKNPEVVLSSFNNRRHIRYNRPLMRCISVALRSCVYLSLIKDYKNIKETPEAFEDHVEFFKQHLNRMIHWIHTHIHIKLQEKVPIISSRMTSTFFSLNTRNCFLVLVTPIPVDNPKISGFRNIVNYIYHNCYPLNFMFYKNGRQAFYLSERQGGNLCTVSSRFDALTMP